jgi:hypothetical protein
MSRLRRSGRELVSPPHHACLRGASRSFRRPREQMVQRGQRNWEGRSRGRGLRGKGRTGSWSRGPRTSSHPLHRPRLQPMIRSPLRRPKRLAHRSRMLRSRQRTRHGPRRRSGPLTSRPGPRRPTPSSGFTTRSVRTTRVRFGTRRPNGTRPDRPQGLKARKVRTSHSRRPPRSLRPPTWRSLQRVRTPGRGSRPEQRRPKVAQQMRGRSEVGRLGPGQLELERPELG